MRCPFCHNMDIVEASEKEGDIEEEEVLEVLSKRAKILDGVCITGGEPTLYPELPDFIGKIKNLGLKVKLDTNGTNPEVVKSLYNKGLIDYVAMDIKSSPAEYENACGVPNINLSPIKETIDFLIGEGSNNLEYEFRTTIVSELHSKEVMEDIGKLIEGADRYYLQNFVDSEYVLNHSLTPASKEVLEEYSKIMSVYVNKVEIRGEM